MGLFWHGYVAGIISALLPSLVLLAWHVSRAGSPDEPASGGQV